MSLPCWRVGGGGGEHWLIRKALESQFLRRDPPPPEGRHTEDLYWTEHRALEETSTCNLRGPGAALPDDIHQSGEEGLHLVV